MTAEAHSRGDCSPTPLWNRAGPCPPRPGRTAPKVISNKQQLRDHGLVKDHQPHQPVAGDHEQVLAAAAAVAAAGDRAGWPPRESGSSAWRRRSGPPPAGSGGRIGTYLSRDEQEVVGDHVLSGQEAKQHLVAGERHAERRAIPCGRPRSISTTLPGFSWPRAMIEAIWRTSSSPSRVEGDEHVVGTDLDLRQAVEQRSLVAQVGGRADDLQRDAARPPRDTPRASRPSRRSRDRRPRRGSRCSAQAGGPRAPR